MNLHKLFLTENECYKVGKKHTVKGIMVHSTGANNPNLKRYVGPDDGLLGVNSSGNHWNRFRPDNQQICVHAFIGKLKDGSVATYQTLPWDIAGWHSGSGSKGNANFMGYIGFEICEDGLTDAAYFNKVYNEAVELCVYLCKKYGLTEKNIICHSEGHKLGIASNHGDVMHWFPMHDKTMDTFRAAVRAGLATKTTTSTATSKPATTTTTATTSTTSTALKVGDKVKMKKNAPIYGKTSTFAAWVYERELYVREINGSRIVVSTLSNGAVTGAVDKKYLTKVASATSNKTYTVVKGDSLWSIAQKQLGKGSRYTEIVKLNGLKTNMIYAGQVLKMPQK